MPVLQISEAQRVVQRLNQLEAERRPFEKIFEDIRTYLHSSAASFITTQGAGERGLDKNAKIYDPTGERALSDLVGAFMGGMVNATSRWFEFRALDPQKNNIEGVKDYLQKLTSLQLSVLNSRYSNFYAAMQPLFYDYAGPGTAFMFRRNSGSKSIFKAVPLADVYFEENDCELIDTVYRVYYLTSKQILDFFPEIKENDPQLYDQLYRSMNHGSSQYNKKKMIHCVRPRRDEERDESKLDDKNKKFGSYYVLEDYGQKLIHESGFDKFPYYGTRFEKVNGREEYGRGLGMRAIKDIKVLNKMVKTNLEAGEQIVWPSLQGARNAFTGPVDMTPRAITWYKAVLGINDPTLRPINNVGNIPVGLEMEEQRRRAIKETFLVDLLQEEKQARLTQFEASANQQDRLMKMAPQLFRFHQEFMTPLLLDLGEELEKEFKKELGDRPPELESIQIVYNGPLALAQKQSEVNNVLGFLNAIGQAGQTFPDLQLLPKEASLGRKIADAFSIDQADLHTQEEIDAIKKERQQIEQNSRVAETLNQLSQAGQNVAAIQQQAGGAGEVPLL